MNLLKKIRLFNTTNHSHKKYIIIYIFIYFSLASTFDVLRSRINALSVISHNNISLEILIHRYHRYYLQKLEICLPIVQTRTSIRHKGSPTKIAFLQKFSQGPNGRPPTPLSTLFCFVFVFDFYILFIFLFILIKIILNKKINKI